MKILKLLLFSVFVSFISCEQDENEQTKNPIKTSIDSKNALMQMSKGQVTKNRKGYLFHFENEKGASIDIITPISILDKFTPKKNNDYGVFTDDKGNQENLYYSSVAIENKTKDDHLTGSLTLTFTSDSEPIVVNFYDLTVGAYFFEIDFLFLPVKTTETFFKPDGSINFSNEEEFFYDERARINLFTKKGGFSGNIEEKFIWIDGKIRTIEKTTIQGDINIQSESIISYNSNGKVESNVTIGKSAVYEGKTTSRVELEHNATTGALEYAKTISFNNDGTIFSEGEQEFTNDLDGNQIEAKLYEKGGFIGEQKVLVREIKNIYKNKKHYRIDIGKTTPNQNLINSNEAYFGSKNRIKIENESFFKDIFGPTENRDITFTYDYFGYPKSSEITLDLELSKTESLTLKAEKTYTYQLALIFKPR